MDQPPYNPLRPRTEGEPPHVSWETPPPRIEDGVEIPRNAYYEPPQAPTIDYPEPFDPTSSLGYARGGKRPRKKQVMWEVVRALTADDFALLNTSLPAQRASLTQIRHSHHQLAQLLSEGKSQHEAGLLTGYSPTYVSVLKDDPSFNELIAYYAAQQELVYVDVLERMKSLGLSTLDELQTRLEDDSSSFTNRELMEQVELMLVKPMVATRGALVPGHTSSGQSSGLSINVNFIPSPTPQSAPVGEGPGPSGPVIDVTPGAVADAPSPNRKGLLNE